MAEHPNIALIRRGYEAFGAGDMDTIRGLFADDIKWHVGGRSPIAGDYKGVDEVLTFFGKIFEVSGGTFKLDIHDMVANDQHVVVLTRSSAERAGKENLDQNGAHVWHVSDGKASEFWGFDEDTYAGDDFFS